MRKVLIIGASSLVGSHLALKLRARCNVVGSFHLHRPPIDGVPFIRFPLRLDTPWSELVEKLRPDTIFYCAAERDEKVCQEQPLHALELNAEIPHALSRSLESTGIRLVYFSTSKVFSGDKGDYSESDATDGVSHYGRSKARGEDLLSGAPNTFILRLGTLYGLGPVPQRSLFNRLISDIRLGVRTPLIQDEFRSFQAMDWVAEVGQRILAAQPSEAGLYHLPSPPKESYFSFGMALAKALGLSPAHLVPISGEAFTDAGTADERGRDTSLDGALFQKVFGMAPKTTDKYLKELAESLRMGSF